MMLQSLYLAGAFAIYSICDWMLTVSADYLTHFLMKAAA